MAKRTATNELNHDNWNDETDPEEAGKFSTASSEVLKQRIIKTAKRRSLVSVGASGTPGSPFGAFKGFQASSKVAQTPEKANFNFVLDNQTPENGHTKITDSKDIGAVHTPVKTFGKDGVYTPQNTTTSIPAVTGTSAVTGTPKGTSTLAVTGTPAGAGTPGQDNAKYMAHLRGLNKSVFEWIKTHIETTPHCILTPVFRDYERHLASIDYLRNTNKDKSLSGIESAKKLPPSTPSSAKEKTEKTPVSDEDNDKKDDSDDKAETGDKCKESPSKPVIPSLFQKSASPSSSNPLLFNQKSATPASSNPLMFKMPEQSTSPISKPPTIPTNLFQMPVSSNSMFSMKPSSGSIFGGPPSSEAPGSTPLFGSSGMTFNFGQGSTPTTTSASASFTFGSGKPFTFSGLAAHAAERNAAAASTESSKNEEENDEPPKVEFNPVTEEDAVYTKKCKVFVRKEGTYKERGVGQLYIKSTNAGAQLLVRAATVTGQVLLNTRLTNSLHLQLAGKNNVQLVCVPTPDEKPPPVCVLLKVKGSEDATELLAKLEEHASPKP